MFLSSFSLSSANRLAIGTYQCRPFGTHRLAATFPLSALPVHLFYYSMCYAQLPSSSLPNPSVFFQPPLSASSALSSRQTSPEPVEVAFS